MENEKIYKPMCCEKCPAIQKEKSGLVCGCQPSKVSSKNKSFTTAEWYRICPIGWDKK